MKIIKHLEKYFEKRDDVLMAFLFGSWAKRTFWKESDIDIGIYFKPKNNFLEWEEQETTYEGEDEIWLDMERILKKNVDLVVLNRATASLALSVLQGIPIIIKDRGIYLDFFLRISREAEDFGSFIEEYWRLKQEIQV